VEEEDEEGEGQKGIEGEEEWGGEKGEEEEEEDNGEGGEEGEEKEVEEHQPYVECAGSPSYITTLLCRMFWPFGAVENKCLQAAHTIAGRLAGSARYRAP